MDLLKKANEAYESGNPILSDEQYDWLFGNKDTFTSGGDYSHLFPMYSLQKVYSEEDIPDLGEFCITPKLDGAAVSITYSNGVLHMALTRGDGKKGKDITDKIKYLVPVNIDMGNHHSICQITGEIVAPSSIANARNYAAGALGLKDIAEFLSRDLTFIAHGVTWLSPNETYTQDMKELDDNGFSTILDVSDIFPTDGIVYRLENNVAFNDLGYTAKHPRGAFALKENIKPIETKLLDVEWQVGRTGRITPVGHIEPIIIGDATISKATLHNAGYFMNMALYPGIHVGVIRAGDIIPQIVERITTGDKKEPYFPLPTKCPCCNSKLEIVNDQLFCVNPQCSAKVSKNLEHFVKTMKIKGLGPKTLEKLELDSISDLYSLSEEDLVERTSEAIGKKIFQEIEKSKNQELSTFIAAFGIPLVGKTIAGKLCKVIDSIDEICEEACEEAGLGEKTTANLLGWDWEMAMSLPISTYTNMTFDKGTVVITGKLQDFKNRAEAAKFLESIGYVVASNVTRSTDFLVCEDGSTSSKTEKANNYNIPIITINYLKER